MIMNTKQTSDSSSASNNTIETRNISSGDQKSQWYFSKVYDMAGKQRKKYIHFAMSAASVAKFIIMVKLQQIYHTDEFITESFFFYST